MSHRTATILQFALSIFALISVSACGFLSLAVEVFQQNARIPGISDDISMYLWAAGLGLTAVLIIPSIWYSWRALTGKTTASTGQPASAFWTWGPLILMLTVFPLVIFFGTRVQGSPLAGWFLPWLHLLSAGLPVFWLVHLAIHRLPVGSPQRNWGIFAGGLLLGPQLIIIAELMIVLVGLFVFIFYVTGQPELLAQLENLSQRLPLAMDSPARMSKILEPYLRNPVLIFSVIGFIAVVVPVIEETLKPVGVWLLVGRDLTAADGFTAGALSGAGYALFETLFLPTNSPSWAVVAVGRVGTSAMHILACALTGWGLALAWREGKYLRLGVQYLAAIALHSAWNAITVLNAAANLLPDTRAASIAAQVLPFGLGLLALTSFILLLVFNRRLAAGTQFVSLEPPALEKS